MNITDALYTGSYMRISQCPTPDKPEVAFIGRSNVGKSSLINMLSARKALAKTSNTPGKTQAINYFLIDQSWYMVDLPGYGFAKASKTSRARWQKMIREYLVQRSSLQFVAVLIDSRHKPQPIDLDFINWLGEMYVPFVLVFTKTDKLSSRIISKNVEQFKKKMLEQWDELPASFLSSSKTGEGRHDILDFIEKTKATFQAGNN